MLSLLKGKLWQVLWLALAACSFALVGMVLSANHQLTKMREERDQLHNEIYNFNTGYVARLFRCENSVADLESSIADQNRALDNMRDITVTRLNEATAKVEAAQKAAAASQRKFDQIMSAPPKGADVCARYDDIDSRFLETLK